MHILIIQSAFIGDVILATPLIEQFAAAYPHARLDFLLRKGNEGLLHAHPKVHQVLIWDKKAKKYADMWRLLKHIRRTKYDAVLNCQRFAASGLLTAFSAAPQRIGFDKNPLSRFFSKKVHHVIGNGKHETERNIELFKAFQKTTQIKHSVQTVDNRPRLYPTPHDVAEAAHLTEGRPYVCLAPTSVWHTKQWPAHKWVALIDALPPRLNVFLLGGPADKAACATILEKAQRKNGVHNVAGSLSFLASAALMARADMNYVNDSAPMHIASAMNAPVTAIFCSTVPSFGFGPLSDVSFIWETKETLPCRPCGLHGKKRCPEGHFKCAEGITLRIE